MLYAVQVSCSYIWQSTLKIYYYQVSHHCCTGYQDLEFDQKVFQSRVQFEDVQMTNTLISVNFTRQLFPNESISTASLVGTDVELFNINTTSLSISNSDPLNSGRYEFTVVVIVNDRTSILATAVVDVLSPSKVSGL